jgi:hypothetical protein
MGRAEHEQYDYRPTVDEKIANVDLLLRALRREHGSSRDDIPPELRKHQERKRWQRP